MNPPNLLTQWARLLLHSLADAGLSHCVLSPGSRSTPFAWAALRCPRLQTRLVVDERSAGFYALGQAKLSQRPSLLICTSGTAAANYFPSVVEAAQSRTPLLVLTADRPFELMDRDAPQTIDQTKLYGDYVQSYIELGMPEYDADALRWVRHTAFAAERATRMPTPGPVHINARAKKPLEPQAATTEAAAALAEDVDRVLMEPVHACRTPRSVPSPDDVAMIARDCIEAASGVIVCGPSPPFDRSQRQAVEDLASETGFTVLCEATSQLRLWQTPRLRACCCDAVEPLLALSPVAPKPHVILQLGPPPTAASFSQYLSRQSDARLYVLARHGWPDPNSCARQVLTADPESTVLALITALREAHTPDSVGQHEQRLDYRRWLLAADRAVWLAVDALLNRDESRLTEGQAVRATLDALPVDSLLVLGNSLPVREVDLYCPGRQGGIVVLSQRGANGIDGLVSGAAGAADLAGGPTTLLLGDVSLLHDLGGLWVAAKARKPLVVVVLNNAGGRIFDTLGVSRHPSFTAEDLEAWITDPGLCITNLADLFAVRHARATTRRDLTRALQAAYRHAGLSLIEAVVDPPSAAEHLSELAERARSAMDSLGPPPWADSV